MPILGWAVVAVIAVILGALIVKNNKHIKDDHSLGGKPIAKRETVNV